MAPSRAERSPSPVAARIARGPMEQLPLPKRLIRQIQKHVASSGRSLQRLEISGRVIENFDDLAGDDSEHEPASPVVASAGGLTEIRHEDDNDLTSLSWLQDRNLLRGIKLKKEMKSPPHSAAYCPLWSSRSWSPPPAVSVPPQGATQASAPPNTQAQEITPCNMQHAKPPYSFSCLIFMAIEAAPTRALPVKEIYAWIIKHFPYFKDAPQGWKNSVRHNLSLNKCFKKVDKAPNLGKGSLWTIDPQHRGNLVQAFGRAPVPCASPLKSPGKGVPDPKLFPYLARRLAATQPDPDPPGRDEYLAAAGVLAMKYGPDVYTKLPLVISEPGQEHTYSGYDYEDSRRYDDSCFTDTDERSTVEALLNLAGITPPIDHSSVGPIRSRIYRVSPSPYR